MVWKKKSMAEFGSRAIIIKEKPMINCQVNVQLGYFLKNGETKYYLGYFLHHEMHLNTF